MQLLKSLVLGALAATALADTNQHHAHRREAEPEPAMDYVTVFNTFYVTAGSTPEAASSTPEAAPTSSTSSTTPAPAAPTSVESSSSSSVFTTTSPEIPASSSSSSSAPAETSSSGGSGAGSAGARGIIYSPYSAGGGCKSSSDVANDLKQLSGYDVIRVYGSDCNQVANVNNAKASNQKLFVGVFDMGSIDSELESIASQLNNDWSDVVTVSIGNELVNNGQATVSQVAGYVQQARSKLPSLGYNGPIVAVDTFIATINNPGLCDVSDYIAVNAHAYFDGGVTSSQAGDWANQQIQRVWGACGGKKSVTIVESGWPSQGPTNGKAVCSQEDQTNAINSLKSTIGDDVYLFTAYNDLWKPAGVEQWWGIYGTSNNN